MDAVELYHRCPLEPSVSVRPEGGEIQSAETIDLSEELLRIHADQRLDPGTSVRVGLSFSAFDQPAEVLEVTGEVLDHYQEPDGAGWQVGIRLSFADEAQEQGMLSRLSSCQGLF
jgi:hypothetical protein